PKHPPIAVKRLGSFWRGPTSSDSFGNRLKQQCLRLVRPTLYRLRFSTRDLLLAHSSRRARLLPYPSSAAAPFLPSSSPPRMASSPPWRLRCSHSASRRPSFGLRWPSPAIPDQPAACRNRRPPHRF